MPFILKIDVKGQIQEVSLAKGENRVGARQDQNIRLSQKGISDQHALIVVEDEGLWIQDLDSEQGTYVNSAPIKESQWLNMGDEINFGPNASAHLHEKKSARPAKKPKPISKPNVEAPQAPAPSAEKSKTKKSKAGGSRVKKIAKTLAYLLGALVIISGIGYFMISSGRLSLIQVSNIFGPGRGDISLINLDTSELNATIYRLDTEEGSPQSAGSESLQPNEIGGIGSLEAGSYRLEITISTQRECFLDIVGGDAYQFVAVPEGIAITREGFSAQNADDVDMATSSLCQR